MKQRVKSIMSKVFAMKRAVKTRQNQIVGKGYAQWTITPDLCMFRSGEIRTIGGVLLHCYNAKTNGQAVAIAKAWVEEQEEMERRCLGQSRT